MLAQTSSRAQRRTWPAAGETAIDAVSPAAVCSAHQLAAGYLWHSSPGMYRSLQSAASLVFIPGHRNPLFSLL